MFKSPDETTCRNAYERLQKWSQPMLQRIWGHLDNGVCPELIGQAIAKEDEYKTGTYSTYILAAMYMQNHPELKR